MLKLISVLLTGVVTSFYFFPFEFTFLPSVNTKMAMAGLGLIILALQLGKARNSVLSKDIVILSILAALVSLAGFLSVTLNETRDYTYVSYIVSMWVWLSGAYVAVSLMGKVHGKISVVLVCNYLIAVCVAQCTIAMLIDSFPIVKNFVNGFLSGTGFMGVNEDRLYGIGAALDVAGSRFASILVMIAFMVSNKDNQTIRKYTWIYLIAFVYIAIVGNMMARTTLVGVVLALLYWFLVSGIYKLKIKYDYGYLWRNILAILMVTVIITTFLYNKNIDFRENLRFGFEGFFSLAEQGKWDVSSNEILMDMFVLPDNLKTWIIGDGYFDNPYSAGDIYYTGPIWGGYYKATDIGYLRFIFYFGLIGLVAFLVFLMKVTSVCMNRFEKWRVMFLLLLGINLIIWLKVSTDIFLVFALFLCITQEENEEAELLATNSAE